jgi:O-antigen ligase
LFLASIMFSGTVAARLLLLAAGLAAAAVLAVRQRGTIRALPPIWLPFALWAGWAMLSLAWSLEPDRTAKELKNEVGYVAASLWFCYVAGQARGAATILLAGFAAAAAAVCGTALFEYYAHGWDGYIAGAHGGAGNFSSTLLVLMPCALMAAWYARQSSWPKAARLVPPALAALFLVAAYTTESRTIWLALAVQLTIGLVLLAWRAQDRSLRRKLVLALVVAGIAGAATAMTAHVQVLREAVGAHSLGNDPRLALWPEVIEKVSERPWLGHGFGRGGLRSSLREELNRVELWHAHNLFLDTGLQTGLPGVALLAALLAAVLWQGWRLAGDSSPQAAACGIALICVVVGMLARNMTDMLLVRQNALLFWATVGVLLAWGTPARAGVR